MAVFEMTFLNAIKDEVHRHAPLELTTLFLSSTALCNALCMSCLSLFKGCPRGTGKQVTEKKSPRMPGPTACIKERRPNYQSSKGLAIKMKGIVLL
eukprot:scaffold23524_cov23-Tisochrysis_lutea.AAC.1